MAEVFAYPESLESAHVSIKMLTEDLKRLRETFIAESNTLRGDINYLLQTQKMLETDILSLRREIDIRFEEVKNLMLVMVNRGNEAIERRMLPKIEKLHKGD